MNVWKWVFTLTALGNAFMGIMAFFMILNGFPVLQGMALMMANLLCFSGSVWAVQDIYKDGR